MAASMNDLIDVLTLEQIETNLFRGRSPPGEMGRIYGGQVIAQALLAAYATVQDRMCHSLQAYFIRPGDPSIPVLFETERSRDGKSFTTRRVIAIQRGEQILNLAASFQIEEDGFEHQDALPDTPTPDTIPTDAERWAEFVERAPQFAGRRDFADRAIELRAVEHLDWLNPEPAPPYHRVWMRTRAPVEGAIMNQVMLAYASDMSLLGTCLRPHGANWFKGGVQTASLDHILWFHRPVKMHEWHLYVQDSPSASGARGFNRGSIFSADGRLVASAVQEGLIRPRAERNRQ
ncbi:MAG: acyl-CoA thioesterase II [Alphaproteobacteria bacterium]|nr:acyl-CoA thioesterase II [Alphaproteobacteria bacterium]